MAQPRATCEGGDSALPVGLPAGRNRPRGGEASRCDCTPRGVELGRRRVDEDEEATDRGKPRADGQIVA